MHSDVAWADADFEEMQSGPGGPLDAGMLSLGPITVGWGLMGCYIGALGWDVLGAVAGMLAGGALGWLVDRRHPELRDAVEARG